VPLPSDEAWVYVIGGIVFLILLLWGWSVINLWVKLFFLVGILGTIGDGIRKFLDCLQYMEVKVFSHGLGISRLSTVYYFPWEQVHHVDLRAKAFTVLVLRENAQDSQTILSNLAASSLRRFANSVKALRQQGKIPQTVVLIEPYA